MTNPPGIQIKALRSVKWIGLTIIVPKLLTPIVTVVLGKLLTPTDFGIVGIAIALNTLADIVSGYNLGQAVIRSEKNTKQIAVISFFTMTTLACLLYSVMWLIAPVLANIYQEPLLIPVIRLANLSLIFNALASVPKALLEREFQYNRLFVVQTGSIILSNLVALIWVLIVPSIWAIVIPPVLAALFQMITSFSLTKWRPHLFWDWNILKEISIFNSFVILTSFMSWLLIYGDNLFAGFLLGTLNLGVYVLGWNLAMVVPSALAGGVAQIAYTTFCRFQDTPHRVGEQLLRVHKLFSVILFPICGGVAIVAAPLSHLIYGDKWDKLPEVLITLSIMNIFLHLWNINDRAYRAVGMPQAWLKGALLYILYGVPILYILGKAGVVEYSIARTLITIPYPFIIMVITSNILKVSIRQQVQVVLTPFFATCVMFVLGMILVHLFTPYEDLTGLLKIGGIIVICSSFYGAMIFLIDKKLLFEFITLSRGAVRINQ